MVNLWMNLLKYSVVTAALALFCIAYVRERGRLRDNVCACWKKENYSLFPEHYFQVDDTSPISAAVSNISGIRPALDV